MQLGCLQRVYSRENIGIPVDWVDTIALAGGNEREVNGDSLSAHVRTCEQRVLAHQNPGFDGSFAFIVINGDVRIFQKSSESNPMVQGPSREGMAKCIRVSLGCFRRFQLRARLDVSVAIFHPSPPHRPWRAGFPHQVLQL